MQPQPWVLRLDLSEMQRLSDWTDRRFETLGLGGATAYAVRLCLDEAVLNVVMHSVPDADHAPEVSVRLDRGDRGLTVTVEDHGPPFDPLAHSRAPRGSTLSDIPVGGLGIHLMRTYASAIEYRRVESVNRLILTFATDSARE